MGMGMTFCSHFSSFQNLLDRRCIDDGIYDLNVSSVGWIATYRYRHSEDLPQCKLAELSPVVDSKHIVHLEYIFARIRTR